MSVRDLEAGTLVDQRYSIISRVGSGGMAEVYCAEDRQLGRKVALKLLHRRFAEDPDFVERFRREASAAAGLQHPNVVGVYDRGEWAGTYYIAMEYLQGRSLRQVLDQEGPLVAARAIAVVVQVLRAARFAHQRGVIHRDIKPHNVIVDEEGRAKVTDFGIARAGTSDITETGSIMGTAQYLSPEQAQGHAVSAQSDLYAIGIVLYELLTGRVPFVGDSAVTIALKQVSEVPVAPSAYNPSIPPELDAIVLRALQKDSAQRFASADEMIAALEEARAMLALPTGQSTAVLASPGGTYATAPTDAALGLPPPRQLSDDELAAAALPPGPLTERGPRRPPSRGALVAAGVVTVLLAAATLFLVLRPEKLALPNVVGTQLSDANSVLRNAGFDVEVQRVVNPAPRDRVLRQDPQPGIEASKGSTVTLSVSDGPGQTPVPDISGQSADDARVALEKAGFRVERSQEASDTVERGDPTRTVPPGGTLADRGSSVTLYVSSGPGDVEVPDVVGQSQASAQGELAGAGFKVNVTEEPSAEAELGTVVSQNPAGGAEASRGSTVTIVVAGASQEVRVPDVIGERADAATAALEGAGLEPVVVQVPVDSADDDGVVQSQDPPGGTPAESGTEVRISVGRFRAPGGGPPGGGD